MIEFHTDWYEIHRCRFRTQLYLSGNIGKKFKHVTKKHTKQNTQNMTEILIINNQQKYFIVVKKITEMLKMVLKCKQN